jgi:hypothetical protein
VVPDESENEIGRRDRPGGDRHGRRALSSARGAPHARMRSAVGRTRGDREGRRRHLPFASRARRQLRDGHRVRDQCRADAGGAFRSQRRGGRDAVRHGRPLLLDGCAGICRESRCASRGSRRAHARCAGIRRRRESRRGRAHGHGFRRPACVRGGRRCIGRYRAKSLPPGRQAGAGIEGQDDQPAAGRRAYRGRGGGDGDGDPRRCRSRRPLRRDFEQRRRIVDVPEPRSAHPCRRLHPPFPP